MRQVAIKVAKREARAAEEVVKARGLPEGVRRFSIEPGEDEDGDPVMWVWFEVDDPNRRDHERVKRLNNFMGEVSDELFDRLEDYRPHVGVR